MLMTNNVIEENAKEVIEALENSSRKLIQWFSNNQMKANTDKCFLLTSSNQESSICIHNKIIKNSKYEKLLGVKINQTLNYNAHINNTCKKAQHKLSALSKITPYIDHGYYKEAAFTKFLFHVSIRLLPFSLDMP